MANGVDTVVLSETPALSPKTDRWKVKEELLLLVLIFPRLVHRLNKLSLKCNFDFALKYFSKEKRGNP